MLNYKDGENMVVPKSGAWEYFQLLNVFERVNKDYLNGKRSNTQYSRWSTDREHT